MAFRQELTPDTAQAESGAMIYPRKKIVSVWRHGDALLVVIEQSTGNKDDDEWNRLFRIYNYARTKREKSEITAKWPFWLWKYHQLARFDSTGIPDVVFESASCTECEPQIILSGLHFDEKGRKWELRPWPKGDEGIIIDDTDVSSVGDYQSVFAIGDFESRRLDEVAVWKQEQELGVADSQPSQQKSAAVLFKFENGVATEVDINDAAVVARLRDQICRANPGQEDCPKGK